MVFGKRVSADVIKDLEMRASWITRVGLYLMTGVSFSETEEKTQKMEQATGPQTEDPSNCQELEEERMSPSPRGRASPPTSWL